MFDIIKPKNHASSLQKINCLLELLKVFQDFDITVEQKKRSYFIFPKTHLKDGYGGVVIYPQTVAHSLRLNPEDRNEDTVTKLTSSFQPKGNEYWVARIFLSLDEGFSVAEMLETQNICHLFYQDLYKTFLAFGKEMRIDYLAYMICIPDTYNIKTYELWPYNLGVDVADPDYEYVHGILSLRGKRFKARSYPQERRAV